MYSVNNLPALIEIGRVGENIFRQNQIDVSAWLEEFPQGHVYFVFKRPDGIVYSPEEQSVENGILTWTATLVDTAVPGDALAEIRIVENNVIGKSAKVRAKVYEGIDVSESPIPLPPDWIDEAERLSGDIQTINDEIDDINENIEAMASNVEELEQDKQEKLVAGENINIDPETNEISASDTTDFFVDIIFNGEKYWVRKAHNYARIVEAFSKDRSVSARYDNGDVVVLPLVSIDTEKATFKLFDGSNTAICRVFKNKIVQLFSGKMSYKAYKNHEAIPADPAQFFADLRGYTDENSFVFSIEESTTYTDYEIELDETTQTVSRIERTYALVDTTFEEIHEAWGAEKAVWCVDSRHEISPFFTYAPADGDNPAVFVFANAAKDYKVSGYRVTSDDAVERVMVEVYTLDDENEDEDEDEE